MTATGTLAQATALATHTVSSVWVVANNFLIALILLAVLFFFAWYVGRGPFVALLLSFYAAFAVYTVFPYMSFLPASPASGGNLTSFFAHVGLYAVLVFVFYLILRRVIVSDFLYIGGFGLMVLCLLGTGFIIALASHSFALASVYQLTPSLAEFLTPAKYFFWWFAGPAIGLLFLAR